MTRLLPVALALLSAAACRDRSQPPVAQPGAGGETDPPVATFAPGVGAADLVPVIDEGLDTPGHGKRGIYFVVLRDGDRHGTAFRPAGFHAVIGAGAKMAPGTLVIRRDWSCAGQIDGRNEQLDRYGISVAVEPGSQRPYPAPVREAAAALVEAISRRVPIHPDCVVAMGEVPFTRPHDAAADETALAAAARERVPVPPADGKVVIGSGRDEIAVDVEVRDTPEGIEVGMMMRHGFDGDARGMLFVYPHADYRNFWMKNCRIPIDVAYVNGGRIEEIHRMTPGFGVDPGRLPRYESSVTARYALEMPAGWFESRGIRPGDGFRLGDR